MSQLKNPHDLLCKKTLGDRENARSFLQHYLPREILELVDMESIEIEKDSFVTADLQDAAVLENKAAGKAAPADNPADSNLSRPGEMERRQLLC